MKQITLVLLLLIFASAPTLAQETGNQEKSKDNAIKIEITESTAPAESAMIKDQVNDQKNEDNEMIVEETVSTENIIIAPSPKTVETNAETISLPAPTVDSGTRQVRQQVQLRAKNINELKEIMQTKKLQLQKELKKLSPRIKKVYQNQNKVREAIHSLIATEDLTGKIGPQISAIAQEFNNSVQATIKAEEKIQQRNRFIKFFTGGDREGAEKILQEVEQNQGRIQKLKQLKKNCIDCDEEITTMLQEQVQNMEQEQKRLQQVATTEKKIKGVWGWVKGLFRK